MAKTLTDHREATGAHAKITETALADAGITLGEDDRPTLDKFADADGKLWPVGTVRDLLKSAASIELQQYGMPPRFLARMRETVDREAGLFGGDVPAKVAAVRKAADDQVEPLEAPGQDVTPDASAEDKDEEEDRIPDAPAASLALSSRAVALNRVKPKLAEALRKAATAISSAEGPAIGEACREALVVVRLIDEEFGLRRRFPDPETAIFPVKVAAVKEAMSMMVQVGNDDYWRKDVASVPPETWDAIGKRAEAVTAGKTDPDKVVKMGGDVVSRVLQNFGIRPATAHMLVEQDDEIWDRIAAARGGRVYRRGNELDFQANHPDVGVKTPIVGIGS